MSFRFNVCCQFEASWMECHLLPCSWLEISGKAAKLQDFNHKKYSIHNNPKPQTKKSQKRKKMDMGPNGSSGGWQTDLFLFFRNCAFDQVVLVPCTVSDSCWRPLFWKHQHQAPVLRMPSSWCWIQSQAPLYSSALVSHYSILHRPPSDHVRKCCSASHGMVWRTKYSQVLNKHWPSTIKYCSTTWLPFGCIAQVCCPPWRPAALWVCD